MKPTSKHALLDLYSGCGGFSLGAHKAGFETKLAIDIDSKLTSSYRLNFPNAKILNADLGRIHSSTISRQLKTKKVCGIIGGPPCQGFSTIGKQDDDDARNELVDQYFRHVSNINPKFFVMENVPGFLGDAGRRALNQGLNRLPGHFDVLDPIELRAEEFGVPTARTRLFVVGFDRRYVDKISKEVAATTPKNVAGISVQDAIRSLPEPRTASKNENEFGWYKTRSETNISKYVQSLNKQSDKHIGWQSAISNLSDGYLTGLQLTKHSKAVRDRFSETEQGCREKVSRYPRLSWSGLCPTLRAGTGSDRGSFQAVRPIHPSQSRVISVREAARLQGFPDWFVFHPTIWHSFRMIGNSVSPPVAEHLLKKLRSRC